MVFNTNILLGSGGQGEEALTVTKARVYANETASNSFVEIWTHDGVSSPDTLLERSVTIATQAGKNEYTFNTDPVVTGESKIWLVIRSIGDTDFQRNGSPTGELIGGGLNATNGDATQIILGNFSGVINPDCNLDLSDGRTSIGTGTNGGIGVGVGGSGTAPDYYPVMGGLVSIA
jgi:hypothetical protein